MGFWVRLIVVVVLRIVVAGVASVSVGVDDGQEPDGGYRRNKLPSCM